jgi:hypothetical protein
VVPTVSSALDEPELVATLRSLVEAIIVHAPANSDKFTVEIRASLSELIMPGPLVKRTGSGGGDSSDSPLPPATCLHHHTATKSRLASGACFTRERSKVRSLVRPPEIKQSQTLTIVSPAICTPKTLGHSRGTEKKHRPRAPSARPLSMLVGQSLI